MAPGVVTGNARIHERKVRLALKFSRSMTALALIGAAGSALLWMFSGARYPELLALVGATGLTAAAAASYRLWPRGTRDAAAIGVMLVIMLLGISLMAAIVPVLLPATAVGLLVVALAGLALVGARGGVMLALVSLLALVVDSLLPRDTAQSSMAVVSNVPAILGFMLVGWQIVIDYEGALAAEHATLRMVIDNLPDYVFVKDTSSRMIINNTAHAWLLGNLTPDQVVGKTDFDFFPRDLAQKYFDDEQQLIKSGKSQVNIEEVTPDPVGNQHYFLTSKMLLHDAKGNVIGVAGICRDITPLKEAELERDRLLRVEQEQREGLEVVVSQLRVTAGQLNKAAAEILAAATQQASSMTEQEAAITQTVATVDELRATVAQTADRAQNVASVAHESVAVSRTGEEAVSHTIEGMSGVKVGVEAISQNILALSERTQQIGEIIDMVRTLADQSKLLALNASIEAARAGTEGRGFAVVAMEVRQLAEQSRQATARVRDILSEIQQATNAAVIASEEGSKGAESGMELVNRAGGALRELAATIETAAQAAIQIAASTHQQANGMEQLATSMAHSRQATSQMAASTQQMKANVQELMALAQQLEQTAERFSK